MKKLVLIVLALICLQLPALAAQPVVAIHVSEVTQALETIPAGFSTPHGSGTTGKEWWTPWWHYFVMSESLKEALRSDGTPFVIVTDADIAAGGLLNADGSPKYPILVSLASEAVRDNEVTPLANYVSAGGFLLVGSSSFTRNPNGSTRSDFALASQMGLHMANGNLQNWYEATTFSKSGQHRLVSHVPNGNLIWHMPLTSDDSAYDTWGNALPPNHYLWQTVASSATVIATADNGYPYLAATNYGQGYFIYYAAMQPLIGHGGFAPSMYSYGIFRNAIEWAFESANLPIVKSSPWPYAYNAAYVVRHDLENYQDMINSIESSAQSEHSVGAKGDYYFCAGTLRVEMNNSSSTIASLRRAISLYGATIGSHNGGLPNPYRPNLQLSDYDYWHWGPDLALDVTPPGYASGDAYASASLAAAFADIDSWTSGLNTNRRTWASPYFNATRERSYQILEQAGAMTAGEQKLSPFPHWTVSTETAGKRFQFVTLPTSEWYVGSDVAQALNWGHTAATVDDLVDYYYGLGALINLYMHEPSTTGLASEYIRHSAAKPAIWPANAASVYQWWTSRSAVQVTPSYTVSGNRLTASATIVGASDPETAIELVIPNWAFASTGVQVKLNGVLAAPSAYRVYNQGIKVKVGTSVSAVDVSYPLTSGPTAVDDSYNVVTGNTLNVSAPGVLGNDTNSGGGILSAVLATQASHGTASLNANGSFTYTPAVGYVGTDAFSYFASNGSSQSGVATVTITVQPTWTPVAQNDTYGVSQSTTLNISAPGVLGNDTGGGSGSTALLVSQPANGSVSLQPDGSFTYVPLASFGGIDTFTYQQNVGGVLSNVATVSVTVTPTGVLFSDDFSGPNGPDPLWTTALGTWNVANGMMNGSSPLWSYSFAYTNGNWSDYSVQGQVQFPAGAFAGGIGGRVNSATGAHYGLWVYPEGSGGGSAVMKLVKFQNWTTWSYTPMAQANLPGVGTTWHTLLLTFQGTRIQASYDGVQYIDVTDNGFDSLPAYITGGVSLGMWTDNAAYAMSVDNILVQALASAPVAQNDTYSVLQGANLTVTAPGVLSNDTGAGAATTVLVSQPANGTLTLQPDGGFTYLPASGFSGTDTFTYQATAAGLSSNTATVTINVTLPSLSSLTLNPASLTGGTSSSATITLSGPAPSGGAVVTLTSSNTAAATVPASVTVAANSTIATFSVNTSPVSSSVSLTISAAYNNTNQTAALTVIPPVPTSLDVIPTSVLGGNALTATVTLSGPAPTGGALLTLNSSNTAVATVPASVTVTANAGTATFGVNTSPVSNNTAVTISATYNGATQTATLTVVPPTLNSLTVSPVTVTGGTSSTATVTLNGIAPAGGAVVTLNTSNASVAGVPASVTVAANTSTTTFTVATVPVANSTTVTVSGTYNALTRNAALTVTPPVLSSLSLNPTSVLGGSSSTGTITLSAPAPASGAIVTLTSSSPSLAPVPSSITVAANATTATFNITTNPVATNTSVTISGTYNAITRNATFTVTAPLLNSLVLNPTSVVGGSSSTGTVTLTGRAPTAGILVRLSSSNTSRATVPLSVTVAGGLTTATFNVTSIPVSSSGSASITASYNNRTRSGWLTVNAPSVTALSLSPSAVRGGSPAMATITLNGPAASGGTSVTLSSTSTAVATVPPSATVTAGSRTTTFIVATKFVASTRTVTITARANGSRSASLTVLP